MNKRNIIVASIIIILSAVIFIFLNMNKQYIKSQIDILENAEIILTDGETEIRLNIDLIKQSGEEKFEAILDTAATEPTKHNYMGVQLQNLLVDNIDLEKKNSVIISAVDGYSVAYSMDEILIDKNIFIAFMEDGKYLKNREDGGRGPYESIVVSDIFSNRRCKWITKIEVK